MSRPDESILIVAVNWIGDTIMALPAIQAFREAHPRARITVLAKPAILPLWAAHAAPDERIPLFSGASGTWRTVHSLRQAGPFDKAYILPNSFRSALIPWLTGIPQRFGVRGHGRRWLLTDPIQSLSGPERRHQSVEYAHLLLGEGASGPLPRPQLNVPASVTPEISEPIADLPRPLIGLIPGAARGPSKQWPSGHFVEVGRCLTEQDSMGVIVVGSAAECELCADVANGIGPGARAIAGRTTLMQWLALLASCDVVVANDSGAMHVAAALGRGVVAIFGLTDPDQTGPLGDRIVILQKSAERNRDIPRVSAAATAALASVKPQEVIESVHALLGQQGNMQ